MGKLLLIPSLHMYSRCLSDAKLLRYLLQKHFTFGCYIVLYLL